MSKRDPRLYLNEIVEACDKVDRYIRDLNEQAFYSAELYQDAVVRNLEIIGEAVSRLPNELRERYPSIPLKRMVGFRNIAIHAYFAVDFGSVWQIATQSLPHLKPQIQQVIEDLGGLPHLGDQ